MTESPLEDTTKSVTWKKKIVSVNGVSLEVQSRLSSIEEKQVDVNHLLSTLEEVVGDTSRSVYMDTCVFPGLIDYILAREPEEFDSNILKKYVDFEQGLTTLLGNHKNIVLIDQVVQELHQRRRLEKIAFDFVNDNPQQQRMDSVVCELLNIYNASSKPLYNAINQRKKEPIKDKNQNHLFSHLLSFLKSLDKEFGLKKRDGKSVDTDERIIATAFTEMFLQYKPITVVTGDHDVDNLLREGFYNLTLPSFVRERGLSVEDFDVRRAWYLSGGEYTNHKLHFPASDEPAEGKRNIINIEHLAEKAKHFYDFLLRVNSNQESEPEKSRKEFHYEKPVVKRKTVKLGSRVFSAYVDESDHVVHIDRRKWRPRRHIGREKTREVSIKPFSREFRREFKHLIHGEKYPDYNPTAVDFSSIVNPLVQQYKKETVTNRGRERIEPIALAAAETAISRYKITPQNFEENKTRIENYVQYALFVHSITGKSIPASRINLEGILDDKGEIVLSKVFEREGAKIFGIEDAGIYDISIQDKITRHEGIKLLRKSQKEAQGIYLFTQKVREQLGQENLSPSYLYKLLPAKLQKHFPKPIDSLEDALAVRKQLEEVTTEELLDYASDIGAYLLGRDVKEESDRNLWIPDINSLLETEKHREALLAGSKAQQKVSKIKWNQKPFEFTVDEMDKVLNFVLNRYMVNKAKFFRRYGCLTGDYNLAVDLAENSPGDISRLHQLTESGKTLSNLLGIEDVRFKRNWKPENLPLGYEAMQKLMNHLASRHGKKAELFFRIYGSAPGALIAAKELHSSYGIDTHPADVSRILTDVTALSESLEIKDPRFERDWKPAYISLSLTEASAMIDYFRQQYDQSQKRFFSVYNGRPDKMIYDLKNNLQMEVNPLEAKALVSDGLTLSILMGVQDPQFNEWKM